MRKFVTLLLISYLFSVQAQWKESFIDGDISQNPTWNGTTDLFTVTNGQLQLNALTSGTAYLSTNSTFQPGTVWAFWIKLNFNTSSQNYARVYLSSNTVDPSLSTQGYYINIGGTADKVSLHKKTGTTTTEIIAGETGQLNLSSVVLQVKVEFSYLNVWKLYVKMSSDSEWILKGEYTDANPMGGDYFTLQSTYTTSNVKSFWFDDIEMSRVPDNTVPKIDTLMVESSSTLRLRFSEAVKWDGTTVSVSTIGTPDAQSLSSDGKELLLHFPTNFAEGVNYTLTVTGLKDLAGNEMATANRPFYYWKHLETPTAGDVVISEIMANPTGAKTLHEAEYVELHNNSSARVKMEGWRFHYGDDVYPLGIFTLLPDSFLIIGSTTNMAKFESNLPKLSVNSFPILANTGKLLYLESPKGDLISFANYNDKWYQDDFRAGGGFSLECIDLNNYSGNSNNWIASKDKAGGTPGKRNSNASVNPETTRPIITETSLPKNDTITILFDQVMNKSDLENPSHYHLLRSQYAISKAISGSPLPISVTLCLTAPIQQSEVLEIEIDSLHSFSGIMLANKTIRMAQSENAATNDVIINEVLFNPRTNGADFVEIYNNSHKIIDLASLRLSSKKSDGTLQSGIPLTLKSTPFFSHEYLVFTTDKSNLLTNYNCLTPDAIKLLTDLPSMPDDAGNIQLVLANGETIDGFYYFEKMHHPFVKGPEGISLERINANRPTNDFSNWQSASSLCGGATPGYQNSQQEINEGEKRGFWVESNSITPDNDGKEDVLRIHFLLPESGYVANIRMYSPTGKLISSLASNTILGTEGVIVWDGTDSSQKLVEPGIYILYVEYYSKNATPIHSKTAIVVGN